MPAGDGGHRADAARKPALRIHIVRHGETAENRAGVIQGQLDTQLNAQGVAQAETVAEALADVPFRVAFASDLARAKSTAQAILARHPGVELQETQLLRERFMADFEGKAATKGMMQAIVQDAKVESKEQFAARAVKWWSESILPLAKRAKAAKSSPTGDAAEPETIEVLAVSHGGLITVLLHDLLASGAAVSSRYTLPLGKCFNTAIATLELHSASEPAVLFKYGDIRHLLKPATKAVVENNVDEV